MKLWPPRIIIDGKEYYSDYRRAYAAKDKDAAAYLARLDREIEDSRAARLGSAT